MAGIVHITTFLVWMLSSYLTNVMLMLYRILLFFFKDPSWQWTVQNECSTQKNKIWKHGYKHNDKTRM